MLSEEIINELCMSYADLCAYLVKKYGPAPCDYFPNPACRARRPQIGRGKEGLYCHHIDEDKGGNLNNPPQASKQPFSWQKADRLVYCNILEHLILHIKIAVMRNKCKIKNVAEVRRFFTTGGIFEICQDINSLFINQGGQIEWRKMCYEVIKNNLEDYVLILKTMMRYIDSVYIGERIPGILKKDGIVVFPDSKLRIVDIDQKSKIATLISLNDSKQYNLPIDILWANDQLHYEDVIDHLLHILSSTYEGELHQHIYDAILKSPNEMPDILHKKLSVDFYGYGHPQFTEDYIDRDTFGSSSVDEYLSKAFPALSPSTYTIKNDKPTFWEGEIPEEVITNDNFYIVRFCSVFSIKDGEEPFVYDHNPLSSKLTCDDDNNFLYKKGKLISTAEYPIALTLTREDYKLFLERYIVFGITIKDGCYFK